MHFLEAKDPDLGGLIPRKVRELLAWPSESVATQHRFIGEAPGEDRPQRLKLQRPDLLLSLLGDKQPVGEPGMMQIFWASDKGS